MNLPRKTGLSTLTGNKKSFWDFLLRLHRTQPFPSRLIPPPGAHLVTCHGVLAPASAMRRRIVPAAGRNGGRREVLAMITEASVVRAILRCLGLSTDSPAVHPARGLPGGW